MFGIIKVKKLTLLFTQLWLLAFLSGCIKVGSEVPEPQIVSRSDESLQAVFNRYHKALSDIYSERQKVTTQLAGESVFRITIATDGAVEKSVVESSTLNDDILLEMINGVIYTMDFGASGQADSVTILYPIDFKPRLPYAGKPIRSVTEINDFDGQMKLGELSSYFFKGLDYYKLGKIDAAFRHWSALAYRQDDPVSFFLVHAKDVVFLDDLGVSPESGYFIDGFSRYDSYFPLTEALKGASYGNPEVHRDDMRMVFDDFISELTNPQYGMELYLALQYGLNMRFFDRFKAQSAFLHAQEAGSQMAGLSIALMNVKGLAVDSSLEYAKQALTVSADQGYYYAQYLIADFYYYGRSPFERDVGNSVKYFKLAAANGLHAANHQLQAICKSNSC